MRRTRYTIVLDSRPPEAGLASLPGLTVREVDGKVHVVGVVHDQAALVSTVARIEDLGNRVLAFRIEPDDVTGPNPGARDGVMEEPA